MHATSAKSVRRILYADKLEGVSAAIVLIILKYFLYIQMIYSLINPII